MQRASRRLHQQARALGVGMAKKGLIPGFEATLDAHFEALVSNEDFKVPVSPVGLGRRGGGMA